MAVARTEALINEGIDRLKAMGADIVLIDPQYVPATAGKDTQEKTNKMVNLLGNIAQTRQVARFPRFAVMRKWHDDQKSFDQFVIGDGLHMSDWGYACFAQLLGDTIIDSVQRVQSGTAVPADVMMIGRCSCRSVPRRSTQTLMVRSVAWRRVRTMRPGHFPAA